MKRNDTLIDRKKLNQLIREYGGDRQFFDDFREEVEKLGALGESPRRGYATLTQNRLLYGSERRDGKDQDYTPLYLFESLCLARLLGVTLPELIKDIHFDLAEGTGIDTYARTIKFQDEPGKNTSTKPPEERIVEYFMEKEKGERVVICQDFPSSIYVDNDFQINRYEQMRRNSGTNTEYYPIKSIINFLLSPVSSLKKVQKISILNKVLETLRADHRHVYFFDHIQDGFPGNFASMNVVNRDALIIILISIPNIVLEIKSRALMDTIMDYFRYRDTKKSLSSDSSEKLLTLSRDLLANQEGSLLPSSSQFLAECQNCGFNQEEIKLIHEQIAL